MNRLQELLVKAHKGTLHFSRMQESEKDATVTRIMKTTPGFDQDLRVLSKYLNASELDIVRLAVAAFIFEVACVKENPEGMWVYFKEEDAEYSEIVLENSMFLPVVR